MTPEEWNTWISVGGGTLALGGAVGVPKLWRLLKRPFIFFSAHLTAANACFEKVDALGRAVADIQKQISNNGGGSIKDRIERMDEILRRRDAAHRFLQDRDPRPMYECDAEGLCTYANRALCDLYGMNSDEMMGNGWLLAIVEEERGEIFHAWKNSIAYRTPYKVDYTVINQRNGTMFECVSEAQAIRGPGNAIIAYFGTVYKNFGTEVPAGRAERTPSSIGNISTLTSP